MNWQKKSPRYLLFYRTLLASLLLYTSFNADAAIDFSKSYSSKVVAVDMPFTVTYTLGFTGFPPGAISLSDTYDASFTKVSEPTPVNCPAWSGLSVTYNNNRLNFSSLLVPFNNGDSCSFKVELKSSVPGVYTSNNTTPAPNPNYNQNINPELVVLFPPAATLAFDQNQGEINQPRQLIIQLQNKNTGIANFTNTNLSITLQDGLDLPSNHITTSDCPTPPTFTGFSAPTVTLSGFRIPPGGCSITLSPIIPSNEGLKNASIVAGDLIATPELLPGNVLVSEIIKNLETAQAPITIGKKPVFTTTALPKAMIGKSYTFQVVAVGLAPLTYESLGLPAGLNMGSDGQINGTPSVLGPFKVDITAKNSAGSTTQTFDLVVAKISPTITSQPPSTGTVGASYDYQPTVTGTPPFSYSASNLPPGLSLDASTGRISGTPSQTGSFNGQMIVSNSELPDAVQNFTINISPALEAPRITSIPPINGTEGKSYAYAVTASGTTPLTYQANGLPPGLAIDPQTGLISGTSFAIGSYSGTITVSNGILPNATQNFRITIDSLVVPTPPQIISAPPENGIFGTAYLYIVRATGTPNLAFTATGLPPGLNLDSSSGIEGIISGVPTIAGSYSGAITVSNGVAPDATQSFTIFIDASNIPQPPAITSTPPASGIEGTSFSFAVSATGSAPLQYTATNLPPGLSISRDTGIIEGIPQQVGTFSGEIAVSNQTPPDARQNFTINIKGRPAVIADNTLPNGEIGQSYAYSLITNGTKPLVYSAQGLPAGLVINRNTGALSGIPTTLGTYNVEFRVQNGYGPDAIRAFSLTIGGTPLLITSAEPTSGQIGVPYNFQFRTNRDEGISYSLINNSQLPSGLSLDPLTGRIFGIPNQSGSFNATIQARFQQLEATQNFTLVILGTAPQIVSTPPPNGVEGIAYQHTIDVNGSPPINITASGLPPGLNLVTTPSPRILGTPLQAGNYTVTISANNGIAPEATQRASITITSGAPVVTSSNQLQGTVLTPFSFTIQALGTPPLRFDSEELPPGLSLDPNSGAISGIPSQAGTFQSRVSVRNSFNPPAIQELSFIIHPQLSSINLTANPSPAVLGQTITLQATVRTTIAPAEGAVLFKEGSKVLGQTSLKNGIATLSLPTLGIGMHNLSAEYRGNTVSSGSQSPNLPLFVSKGILLPSKTSLSVKSTPALTTMDATVSVNHRQIKPDGLVAFYIENEFLGTAPVLNGQARFFTPLSIKGPWSARYLGNYQLQSSTAANIGSGTAIAGSTINPLTKMAKAPSTSGAGSVIWSIAAPQACILGPIQPLTMPEGSRFLPMNNLPQHSYFPEHLAQFSLQNCPKGSTITLTVAYPNALPNNTQYWQFGPTPEQKTPHWYQLPASVNDNIVTFQITDGAWGDQDLIANGNIQGLGGILSVLEPVFSTQP